MHGEKQKAKVQQFDFCQSFTNISFYIRGDTSQLVPLRPSKHVHRKELSPVTVHNPSKRQGFGVQESITDENRQRMTNMKQKIAEIRNQGCDKHVARLGATW